MHSVDETKKRFDKYMEFTKYSQLNLVSYPFNIIDNIEVNVISTRKVIEDLLREAERHATDASDESTGAPTTGAADDDDVEVYIY